MYAKFHEIVLKYSFFSKVYLIAKSLMVIKSRIIQWTVSFKLLIIIIITKTIKNTIAKAVPTTHTSSHNSTARLEDKTYDTVLSKSGINLLEVDHIGIYLHQNTKKTLVTLFGPSFITTNILPHPVTSTCLSNFLLKLLSYVAVYIPHPVCLRFLMFP